MSDFKSWNQKSHARTYLLYPENMELYLSIDETALSQGDPIIKHLPKLTFSVRNKAQEITLNITHSIKYIVKTCFLKQHGSLTGSTFKNWPWRYLKSSGSDTDRKRWTRKMKLLNRVK